MLGSGVFSDYVKENHELENSCFILTDDFDIELNLIGESEYAGGFNKILFKIHNRQSRPLIIPINSFSAIEKKGVTTIFISPTNPDIHETELETRIVNTNCTFEMTLLGEKNTCLYRFNFVFFADTISSFDNDDSKNCTQTIMFPSNHDFQKPMEVQFGYLKNKDCQE